MATISAGNDELVGNLIAEALDAVGADGVLSIETSNSLETTVEVQEGMLIDRGYISPQFVTNLVPPPLPQFVFGLIPESSVLSPRGGRSESERMEGLLGASAGWVEGADAAPTLHPVFDGALCPPWLRWRLQGDFFGSIESNIVSPL